VSAESICLAYGRISSCEGQVWAKMILNVSVQ